MTRHPTRTGAARAVRAGRRAGLAVVVTATLAATASLAGCGDTGADSAAPHKVRGTAAPVEGDAPGDKSGDHRSPGAKKPGGDASSSPSGSGGGAHGGPGGSAGGGGGGDDDTGEARTSGGEGGEGGGSGSACGSGDLSASVGTGHSGAGQRNFPLVLTNNSSRSCTVNGYPGLAFVNGDGEQVSVEPERTGSAGEPVRLSPGESAWAPLSFTSPDMTGVATVTPDAVRITPPNEEASLGASWPGEPVTASGEGSVPKVGALSPGNGP